MRYFSIKPASFNGMVQLAERILKCDNDLFECKTAFLRPYCVAYLDQVLSALEQPPLISSSYGEVNQYLAQVKFTYRDRSAVRSKPFPKENIIPLIRFKGTQDQMNEAVPAWLEQEVLSKSFAPDLAPKLRKEIVQNLWEIVCNASQHSESKYGISCCGQFYPLKGYFEICFCDIGVGIPFTVRNFLQPIEEWSDSDCILWALQSGTTTKEQHETGGMGLYYLTEFLKLNGGCLQIVSHYGFYQAQAQESAIATQIGRKLTGTLFNLRIIYDNYRYKLAGE